MATNSEARKRSENVRTVSATIPVTNEAMKFAEEQTAAELWPYASKEELMADIGRAIKKPWSLLGPAEREAEHAEAIADAAVISYVALSGRTVTIDEQEERRAKVIAKRKAEHAQAVADFAATPISDKFIEEAMRVTSDYDWDDDDIEPDVTALRIEIARAHHSEASLEAKVAELKDELELARTPNVPIPNRRSQILQGAEKAVNGDRNVDYGDPRADFARTAALWNAYLGTRPIDAHDVAAMMALLKISRIAWSPEKQDNWLDLAGYAACGWDCAAP